MARKAGTNGRSSTPQATTLIVPSKKVLVGASGEEGLKKTRRIQTQKSRSAMGVYRNALKESQEKEHLDKRAWAIVNQLDDLSDEDLHVTYFHLMHYLDKMGVTKRATAQEEMFEGNETGPSPKANGRGKDEDDDKVTRIGAAARKVAEDAGASLPK